MEPKSISHENKFEAALQDTTNEQACTGKVEQDISKLDSVPQEGTELPTYLPDVFRQISGEPENPKRRAVVDTRNNDTKTANASKNDNEPKQTTENLGNLGNQYRLNDDNDDQDDVVQLAARYVRNEILTVEIFTEKFRTHLASNPLSFSNHDLSAVEIEQMAADLDNGLNLLDESIKKMKELMQLYEQK